MNILRLVKRTAAVSASTQKRERAPSSPQQQPRSLHRDRDFGIGYGNSSGYGQDRRYAGVAARPMFRCS